MTREGSRPCCAATSSMRSCRSSARRSGSSPTPRCRRWGRLGGAPPLPPGTDWPLAKGVPQLCLATLDGAALAALAPDTGIAPAGFTSFFYDATLESDVIDPSLEGRVGAGRRRSGRRVREPSRPVAARRADKWVACAAAAHAPASSSASRGPPLARVRRRRPRQWWSRSPRRPRSRKDARDRRRGAGTLTNLLLGALAQARAPGRRCHSAGGWTEPLQYDPREPGRWRQLLQVDSDDALGIIEGGTRGHAHGSTGPGTRRRCGPSGSAADPRGGA
jgi:hypothetical protein